MFYLFYNNSFTILSCQGVFQKCNDFIIIIILYCFLLFVDTGLLMLLIWDDVDDIYTVLDMMIITIVLGDKPSSVWYLM